jgi:hypothetical protein
MPVALTPLEMLFRSWKLRRVKAANVKTKEYAKGSTGERAVKVREIWRGRRPRK